MGSKTVRFEEFDQRVQEYWHPSDYDAATVSAEVAEIAQGWRGQGFVRLVFDDATLVLTEVQHRMENGSYQRVWETADDPATALAGAQGAARAENRPASWDEMWTTWKGWDEFCRYAEQTHSSENTNFLLAVHEYRQSPSVPAQLDIYGRFIVAGAPEQVTLDNAELVSEIENRADGGADVFDAAEQEVIGMLRGQFAGFLTWYDNQ